MTRLTQLLWGLIACAMLGGCAAPKTSFDYSEFQKSRPATLLVLPPVSDAADIKASPAVWAHAARPLAEAGYYVYPVTLVDEALRQNGIQTASDAHAISAAKLREVFGADAAVYIKIVRYGTSYKLLDSETRVTLEARVVDLRSGALLWSGSATASSAEQSQQNQGGLAGLLLAALVKQVTSTVTDASYNYAAMAQMRLLGAPRINGMLPGPRSPQAWQQPGP